MSTKSDENHQKQNDYQISIQGDQEGLWEPFLTDSEKKGNVLIENVLTMTP